MTFAEKIQKYLENNQIKQVIDEFRSLISECPASDKDAFSDANQLRSQVVVLAGRYNSINDKINLGTANPESANIEKTSIVNSFVQILNQLPDTYPDLSKFINNRDEEEAWKEAQKINTIDGYDRYFKKYPNGKYIAETHRLMKDLNEIKRTQEEEMKRVAQEEKERRDREAKIREESTPADTTKTDNKVKDTSNLSAVKNENQYRKKINPADSGSGVNKTLIYAGIGGVVLILLIVFLMKGSDNSDTKNLTDSLTVKTGMISVNKVSKINYSNPKTGKTGNFSYDKTKNVWLNDDGEGNITEYKVPQGENPDASLFTVINDAGEEVKLNLEQKEIITGAGEEFAITDLESLNPDEQKIIDEIFDEPAGNTPEENIPADNSQNNSQDNSQDNTQDNTPVDNTQDVNTQDGNTQDANTQESNTQEGNLQNENTPADKTPEENTPADNSQQ